MKPLRRIIKFIWLLFHLPRLTARLIVAVLSEVYADVKTAWAAAKEEE